MMVVMMMVVVVKMIRYSEDSDGVCVCRRKRWAWCDMHNRQPKDGRNN